MRTLLTSALCAALLSCGPGVAWAAPAPDAADMSKPATEHTRAAHAAMSKEVDFADRQDFQDASAAFWLPCRKGAASSTPTAARPGTWPPMIFWPRP